MIDEIITGIADDINSCFEESRIYREQVRQGLIKPCFFIEATEVSEQKMLGNRFLNDFSFEITYYPSDTVGVSYKTVEETQNVAEALYDVLEYITADGSFIRGRNMRHEIKDGVLSFHANYSMFIYKTEENNNKHNELMGDLSLML